MLNMEGTLWKWTNYFSGWQPRWFILDNGILSYYKSQDDVNSGCKGSIKMAVCDVIVHQTDSSRLDLIIPGEAHFYVKAATAQERQQWLVALGSCKACLTNGTPQPNSTAAKGEEIPENRLKAKRSELRLYCDLLMQQVHSVKTAATDQQSPDVEKINEATSLLSATCDTFIKTLEECMTIANANINHQSQLSNSPEAGAVLGATGSPSKAAPKKSSTRVPFQRSGSVDRYIPSNRNQQGVALRSVSEGSGTGIHGNKFPRSSGSRTASESEDAISLEFKSDKNAVHEDSDPAPQKDDIHKLDEKSSKDSDNEGKMVNHIQKDSANAEEDSKIPTYFSSMETSFMDLKMKGDGGIPTKLYLEACKAVVTIFDKLNPTAFAPLKMDFTGNYKKLEQKYSTDPEKFETLQDMVKYEIANKQNHLTNSATTSLLWLKRSLEFIAEFLRLILNGSSDLEVAANAAYSKTLKQFHGWVVRGVFAVAIKAMPTKQNFVQELTVRPEDKENPSFEKKLMKDVEHYLTALDVVQKMLTDFYADQNIDVPEQV